jgi:hypothetical protein
VPLDPEGKPIIAALDETGRLRLAVKLLTWLTGKNILVWENGLDSMWNSFLRRWIDDPMHESTHWGPKYNKYPKNRNRGKVWLYSGMPMTSVKTQVFFCFLSVAFKGVLSFARPLQPESARGSS